MGLSNGYTPTQRKMLAVLSDGLPHPRAELHACLNDELQPHDHIHPHLDGIRKHIRPKGQDIICQLLNKRCCYRLIRLLAGPND